MQQPKQQQYGSVGVIHELVEELVQSMTGKKSKTLTQLSMRILSSRIEAKSTETVRNPRALESKQIFT